MSIKVDVICPTCTERRYTSIRAIDPKEVLSAALFRPLGESPAMSDGEPALCYACGSALKFMKSAGEQSLVPPSREEMMRQRTSAQPTESPADILFEARQGEDVKEMLTTPDGIVVITNKRIVRIRV